MVSGRIQRLKGRGGRQGFEGGWGMCDDRHDWAASLRFLRLARCHTMFSRAGKRKEAVPCRVDLSVTFRNGQRVRVQNMGRRSEERWKLIRDKGSCHVSKYDPCSKEEHHKRKRVHCFDKRRALKSDSFQHPSDCERITSRAKLRRVLNQVLEIHTYYMHTYKYQF